MRYKYKFQFQTPNPKELRAEAGKFGSLFFCASARLPFRANRYLVLEIWNLSI